MTAPPHNYHWACGQTVWWDTSDNQDRYNSNLNNDRTADQLRQLGYVDNPIAYTFNSQGFRTAEFDHAVDAVCFGCSFTMGTGLHAQHTWPEQLQSIAGLTVLNLGHAGSSNDTAYRMARHYLPLLRPRYALWLQTDRHRLELLDDVQSCSVNLMAGDHSDKIYGTSSFVQQWWVSDSNQLLNLEKNTRAFKSLCSELDIQCVIIPRESVVTLDLARDLKHPGQSSMQALALTFAKALT